MKRHGDKKAQTLTEQLASTLFELTRVIEREQDDELIEEMLDRQAGLSAQLQMLVDEGVREGTSAYERASERLASAQEAMARVLQEEAAGTDALAALARAFGAVARVIEGGDQG